VVNAVEAMVLDRAIGTASGLATLDKGRAWAGICLDAPRR
jgi:hypothetical protein